MLERIEYLLVLVKYLFVTSSYTNTIYKSELELDILIGSQIKRFYINQDLIFA